MPVNQLDAFNWFFLFGYSSYTFFVLQQYIRLYAGNEEKKICFILVILFLR